MSSDHNAYLAALFGCGPEITAKYESSNTIPRALRPLPNMLNISPQVGSTTTSDLAYSPLQTGRAPSSSSFKETHNPLLHVVGTGVGDLRHKSYDGHTPRSAEYLNGHQNKSDFIEDQLAYLNTLFSTYVSSLESEHNVLSNQEQLSLEANSSLLDVSRDTSDMNKDNLSMSPFPDTHLGDDGPHLAQDSGYSTRPLQSAPKTPPSSFSTLTPNYTTSPRLNYLTRGPSGTNFGTDNLPFSFGSLDYSVTNRSYHDMNHTSLPDTSVNFPQFPLNNSPVIPMFDTPVILNEPVHSYTVSKPLQEYNQRGNTLHPPGPGEIQAIEGAKYPYITPVAHHNTLEILPNPEADNHHNSIPPEFPTSGSLGVSGFLAKFMRPDTIPDEQFGLLLSSYASPSLEEGPSNKSPSFPIDLPIPQSPPLVPLTLLPYSSSNKPAPLDETMTKPQFRCKWNGCKAGLSLTSQLGEPLDTTIMRFRYTIVQHIRTHTSNCEDLSCQWAGCTKVFADKRGVKRHIFSGHLKAGFLCERCKHSFSRETSRRYHRCPAAR